MNIRVEIPQLDTVDGVFKLQSGHMTKIQTYIGQNCSASGAFSGLVLKPLESHYTPGYDAGYRGMGQGREISDACSTVIQGNKRQYLKDDKAAYDRLKAQNDKLGLKTDPYKPPGSGPAPKPGAPANSSEGSKFWKYTQNALGWGGKVGKYYESTVKYVNGKPVPVPAEKPGLERGKAFDPKAWAEYYRQRAGERVQNNRDWREADRRNGADTRGNSSWTGDQIREERERGQWNKYDKKYQSGHDYASGKVKDGTHYNGPVDDDHRPRNDKRPGSLADGADKTVKDAGKISRTAGLPSAMISTGQNMYNSFNDLGDASEANKSANNLAKGPSNTESHNWADKTKKGGGW